VRIGGQAASRTTPPPHRPRIIAALGVTQIFAWGSSYYLPAVLARPISADTGWPFPWVVGGLSLGLLAAGLVSPRVGRMIERHGGRPVLAASAVLLAAGLVGLALAHGMTAYLAAWLVLGLGMGAGLYDAAFATLGRLFGLGARQAIGSLTLFGGFASTVCWPLSAFLVAELGWRGACLSYAAFQLAVALPIHLLLLPRVAPRPAPTMNAAEPLATTPVPRRVTPILLLLAAALTLSSTISAVVSVHLLSFLQAREVSAVSAVALGALVGPSQVGARAIEILVARYHHPVWTKVASTILVALGLAALWGRLPLLSAALVLYGAGIGLESIARGTLPLALFGADGYASLMGRLAMPSLIAQAVAPSLGALLMEAAGIDRTLAVLAVIALINVAFAGALAVMRRT
jgi:MFS family permease